MSFPWWVWVLLVVGALLFLMTKAAKSWRASVRREIIDYIRREEPGIEVVSDADYEIHLRIDGDKEAVFHLQKLLIESNHLQKMDLAAREQVYAHYLKAIREGEDALNLDAPEIRRRILPRIVRDEVIRELTAANAGKPHPCMPLVPGLSILFVLDSEASVAHLGADQLEQLGLGTAEALDLAVSNLRGSFSEEVVRKVLDEGVLSVVKSFDSFDAARLLLVPESLREGESVVATIPDRDTLALALAPVDGDWASMRRLAQNAAGEPLWTEPLLVTRAGVSAIP